MSAPPVSDVSRPRFKGARAALPRGGFTLIEVVVASMIFLTLGGIVFQFFTTGSRAGAKATCRTQVTGRTRNAVRQMKQLIEASSYPSVVSLRDYAETTDTFEFIMDPGGAGTAAGAVTTFTFTAIGDIASFHRCHPLDRTPMAPPVGELNGLVAQHTFRLEDSEEYPGDRMQLSMLTTTGTVNAVISPAGAITMTVGALANPETRRLATEVESVSISVPTAMIGQPNSVISLRITCQDPIDGRMRVVEAARANVNVTLLAP